MPKKENLKKKKRGGGSQILNSISVPEVFEQYPLEREREREREI